MPPDITIVYLPRMDHVMLSVVLDNDNVMTSMSVWTREKVDSSTKCFDYCVALLVNVSFLSRSHDDPRHGDGVPCLVNVSFLPHSHDDPRHCHGVRLPVPGLDVDAPT